MAGLVDNSLGGLSGGVPPGSLLPPVVIPPPMANGFSAQAAARIPAGVAQTAATVSNISISAADKTNPSPPPLSTHKTSVTSPKEMIESVNRQHIRKQEELSTEKKEQLGEETKNWRISSLKTSKVFNAILMAVGIAVAFSATLACILCPPAGVAAIGAFVMGSLAAPVVGAVLFGYGLGHLDDELTWKPEERIKFEKKAKELETKYETVATALKLFEKHPNVGNGDSFEEFLNNFSTGFEFDIKNLKEIIDLYESQERRDILKLKNEVEELQEIPMEQLAFSDTWEKFVSFVSTDAGYDAGLEGFLRTTSFNLTTPYALEKSKIKQLDEKIEKLDEQIKKIPIPNPKAKDPQSVKNREEIVKLTAEKAKLEKIKVRKENILKTLESTLEQGYEIQKLDFSIPHSVPESKILIQKEIQRKTKQIEDTVAQTKIQLEQVNSQYQKKQAAWTKASESFNSKCAAVHDKIRTSDQAKADAKAKLAAGKGAAPVASSAAAAAASPLAAAIPTPSAPPADAASPPAAAIPAAPAAVPAAASPPSAPIPPAASEASNPPEPSTPP